MVQCFSCYPFIQFPLTLLNQPPSSPSHPMVVPPLPLLLQRMEREDHCSRRNFPWSLVEEKRMLSKHCGFLLVVEIGVQVDCDPTDKPYGKQLLNWTRPDDTGGLTCGWLTWTQPGRRGHGHYYNKSTRFDLYYKDEHYQQRRSGHTHSPGD